MNPFQWILVLAMILLLGAQSAFNQTAFNEDNKSEDNCQAWWEGWEYDVAAKGCVYMTQSACSNPFYDTQADCEQAHAAEFE